MIRDLSDIKSIEELNQAFLEWVENIYHQRTHNTIGMKPVDRFALDVNRIQYLPICDYNDELFYLEGTRVVIADNTFSFAKQRYECPVDLRNQKINIRYDRLAKANGKVIVYQGSNRLGEAEPVNYIGNDRPPKTSR